MFFYLSKIIWFFLQPTSVLLVLALIGILFIGSKRQRLGRNLALFSICTLIIFGFSPLGNILIIPLEDRMPRVELDEGAKIDGIIILGGAIDAIVSRNRPSAATNEAAERLIEGAKLARRWPNAKILFSGASGNLVYNVTSGARYRL